MRILGPGYFNVGSAAVGIVIFMKIIVALAPAVILFSSFVTIHAIQDPSNDNFQTKYSSLFGEFKNSKGYLSSQYYSVFLLRRLSFMLSQVLLNDYLFIQAIINIASSLLQLGFLIIYLPFKDTGALLSVISGEIATTIFISGSLVFLYDISPSISAIVEIVMIYSAVSGILIQIFVCIHSTLISLKQLWKVLKERIKLDKTHKIAPTQCTKDEFGIVFTTEPNNSFNLKL